MAGNSEILKGYPIEEFLTDQDGRAWNKDTKACYSRLLYETKQYFDENGPLNSHTLEQWQADLLAREYKQRSINTRISALNNYLKWCGRHDLVMKHWHPGEETAPALTRAEYLCLLRAARQTNQHRLYLLIKVFAITGVPVHCLSQVTVELIRQGNGALHGRGNNIPFHCPSSLQRELLEFAKENRIQTGPVFITRRGTPMNRSTICRLLQELSRTAGIPENKVSPRSLRNLCQIAQEDLYANLEQMLKSAYDQLLETENTVAGWKAGA